MRGLLGILSLFRNEFNKFNNAGARTMLDSMYHMTLKLFKNRIFGVNILSSFTQCYDIGITHVLYALTSAGPRGWCRNPTCKARVRTTPEGSSRCYWIGKPCLIVIIVKVILSLENFGKTHRKVHFCITIMARKSMNDS